MEIAIQAADQLRIVVGQHAEHAPRRQPPENVRQPDVIGILETFFRVVRKGCGIHGNVGRIEKDEIALFRRAHGVLEIPVQDDHIPKITGRLAHVRLAKGISPAPLVERHIEQPPCIDAKQAVEAVLVEIDQARGLFRRAAAELFVEQGPHGIIKGSGILRPLVPLVQRLQRRDDGVHIRLYLRVHVDEFGIYIVDRRLPRRQIKKNRAAPEKRLEITVIAGRQHFPDIFQQLGLASGPLQHRFHTVYIPSETLRPAWGRPILYRRSAPNKRGKHRPPRRRPPRQILLAKENSPCVSPPSPSHPPGAAKHRQPSWLPSLPAGMVCAGFGEDGGV